MSFRPLAGGSLGLMGTRVKRCRLSSHSNSKPRHESALSQSPVKMAAPTPIPHFRSLSSCSPVVRSFTFSGGGGWQVASQCQVLPISWMLCISKRVAGGIPMPGLAD